MSAQLTREQKLLAEQVVQLGNIAEAIRAAAMGQDSSNLMDQIQQLRTELTELTQQRAELTTALAESNTKVAELQASLAGVHDGDITPDSINEVMSHLGIDYQ
tara:strand:- start:419 stop:727 length:309 start_codon:yes stop_codon:yes gene_type:complete